MVKYIFKRIFISLLILFCISFIIYALIRVMPGDYISNMVAENPDITDEMLNDLKALYGLDSNIFEGYLGWAAGVLNRNLGFSFSYDLPVATVISSKMWISFFISFSALVIQILIAIPLGVFCAANKDSFFDKLINFFLFVTISLPSFFFAVVLQKIFAVDFKIFPLYGMISARGEYHGINLIFDIMWHLVLPIILLVILNVGFWLRYIRSNMLDILNENYILTARAKGLHENKIMYKHALRNTMIPVVTMIGKHVPSLFSGAIIVETVFGVDGLGFTMFQSLKSGDIPLIMGFSLFLAAVSLMSTLFSDIVYTFLDPRIRIS